MFHDALRSITHSARRLPCSTTKANRSKGRGAKPWVLFPEDRQAAEWCGPHSGARRPRGCMAQAGGCTLEQVARGPAGRCPEPCRERISGPQRTHAMLSRFTKSVSDFLVKEDGPTAVEYAVMLALIIVVCIAAITTLGNNAKATFTGVGTAIGTGS